MTFSNWVRYVLKWNLKNFNQNNKMKELKLEVGQKVWTIQSGYCQLMEIDKDAEYCFVTIDKDGRRNCYNKFGKYGDNNANPSLFESNPFEHHVAPNDVPERSVDTNKTINKAEMINALFNVANVDWDTNGGLVKIAREKLQKLLESL